MVVYTFSTIYLSGHCEVNSIVGQPDDYDFKQKEVILFMKLTKANMKKKLGMKDEEIKLVLDYQEAFPSLQDTSKDAVVDGRTLWEELKVQQDFTHWIKKQLEKVDAVKGEDFSVVFENFAQFTQDELKEMSSQQRSAYGVTVEYVLNIDIAKEIAMVTGVAQKMNEETKRLSKLVRKYFITIEKAIRLAHEWEDTRLESKKLQKQMMSAYEEAYVSEYNRKPRNYGTIQDDVYYVCFDMSAKQLKKELELKYYQAVPEWVEEEIEKALCYAYEKMITFFEMGMLDDKERFNMAVKLFDKKFGGVIEI